jgi:hypothetical protein
VDSGSALKLQEFVWRTFGYYLINLPDWILHWSCLEFRADVCFWTVGSAIVAVESDNTTRLLDPWRLVFTHNKKLRVRRRRSQNF